MLKMLRNKKAITPVLSNVLLLAIAVGGMSIAVTATYVITGNLREMMGERFIIEDVWFRNARITIFLRNTGKTPLDVAAVYIDHVAQPFAHLHLEPLRGNWLDVTFMWTSNTVYQIKILTSRGTQVEDYYKAPA